MKDDSLLNYPSLYQEESISVTPEDQELNLKVDKMHKTFIDNRLETSIKMNAATALGYYILGKGISAKQALEMFANL